MSGKKRARDVEEEEEERGGKRGRERGKGFPQASPPSLGKREREDLPLGSSAPPKRPRIAPKLARTMEQFARAFDELHEAQREVRMETRLAETALSFITNNIENGHSIMHSMREQLAKLDTETFYRSKDQRLIQHQIMAGLSRFVYGPDLKSHEMEVRKFNKFETLRQEIFLTAPRRGGKTQSIAQMCAVIMYCVPQADIAAFAPSGRAAGTDSGLMGHVKKILQTVYGITKFERHNQESLFYKHSDTDIRKFHAYPGGATHKYVFFCFLYSLSLST